jgi:hypothetical protein
MRAPKRGWSLAVAIGAALVLKFFLLFLIWKAFFSHPPAKKMRLPTEVVEQHLLNTSTPKALP